MSDNKVRLLIEVPKEFYKILMESSVYIDEVGGVLQDSAKIGTVITDDCISRKALEKAIKTECNPYGAPTIDYKSGLRVLEIIDRALPIGGNEE